MTKIKWLPSRKKIPVTCPNCKKTFIHIAPSNVEDRHEYLVRTDDITEIIECPLCQMKMKATEGRIIVNFVEN